MHVTVTTIVYCSQLSRKTTFMEEDLLDQKKEQEEKLLLLAVSVAYMVTG